MSDGATSYGTMTVNGGAFTAYLNELIVGYNSSGQESGIGTLDLRNATAAIDVNGTVVIGYATADGRRAQGQVYLGGGTFKGTGLTLRNYSAAPGTLQGWGGVAVPGTVTMNGQVVADGYGTDHTLYVTNYTLLANGIDNSTIETNGWYAQNKGKLELKPLSVTGTGAKYWAEDDGPDLINAVKLNFTSVTGSGTVTGALYASDHTGVPAYTSDFYKAIGIWEFTQAGLTLFTNHRPSGVIPRLFVFLHAEALFEPSVKPQ